jgi:hypothetical protein
MSELSNVSYVNVSAYTQREQFIVNNSQFCFEVKKFLPFFSNTLSLLQLCYCKCYKGRIGSCAHFLKKLWPRLT